MIEKITILGSGKSGLAAARLARSKGYAVFLSDANVLPAGAVTALEACGAGFEQGEHSERCLQANLIIKSPGIPNTVSILKQAEKQGVKIVSEVEFAARYIQAPLIGITGTNGKTTTTLLTTHLLVSAGIKAIAAGNVGLPLAQVALQPNQPDVVVLELSSFQLDDIVDMQLCSSALLNITPDHLDRYHNSIELYAKSKFKIANLLSSGASFIYGSDCPIVAHNAQQLGAYINKLCFGFSQENNNAYFNGTSLMFRPTANHHTAFELPKDALSVKGPHNIRNALAAGLLARPFVQNWQQLRRGFETFCNAPHRLATVGHSNGVTFVDDSKATNVDATQYALQSYPDKTVVWVAGGIDKGNNYEAIATLLANKVKAIIALTKHPEKLQKISAQLGIGCYTTTDVNIAVTQAASLAKPQDTVLLSPACASFDLFENYQHRGQMFATAVDLYIKEEKTNA